MRLMRMAILLAAVVGPAGVWAREEAPLLQYSVNSVVFGWNTAAKEISVDEIAALSGPLSIEPGAEEEGDITRIPVSKDGRSYFQIALPSRTVTLAPITASVSNSIREQVEAHAADTGVSLQDVMSRSTNAPASAAGAAGLEGRTWKYYRCGLLVDEGPLWEIKGLAGLFLFNEKPDLADMSPLADLTGMAGSRLWLDLSGNLMADTRALGGLTNCWWLYLSNSGLSNLTALASLKELRALHLSDNPVRDLRPLTGLPNLRRLYLAQTGLTDLAPFSGMKSLTGLDLSGNGVTDLRPLAGLGELEWLHLGGNPITDPAPLAGLRRLKLLNLGANKVSDLSFLGGLTNLVMLHLPANAVSDVGPLAALTQLRTLNIAGNSVSNLAPLAGLSGLVTLHANGNPVTNLAPLAKLVSLQTLNLAQTGAADLGPLENLKNVKTLYLFGNQITDLGSLIRNASRGGLGKGDSVWLVGNPLSAEARDKQIPVLRNKYGVQVHF